MSEDENNEMTTGSAAQVPISNSMAAFSGQIEQLVESLDLLYIKNNAGGRKIFRDKWPEVADYVFGSELTTYDMDGVMNDEERTHRSEMEDEAGMRRIDLKQTMSELVEKSVDAGSLLSEYVGSVVDQYGPLLSQFLYAEDIIERVRPGVMAEAKKAQEAGKEQEATPEQAAPQEPQVVEEQEVVAPQETSASTEDGETQPSQESQPEPAPEQNASEEQNQDIAGTQQISEPEGAPDVVQQTEIPDSPEEPAQQAEASGISEGLGAQQSELVAEPSEANHIQPPVDEESTKDDRLSVEEVELLSNKEPEEPVLSNAESELDTEKLLETLAQTELAQGESEPTPELEPFFADEAVDAPEVLEPVAQEAPLAQAPAAQEDPLEHVRPIETPLPESTALEGEAVQDVSPEEVPVEAEQGVENVVSEEAPAPQIEPEPFFVDETMNVQEPFFVAETAKVPETPAPVVQEEPQNIEVVAQPEEAISNEELSIEQEQIHAAAAVREILADETQSLVAPELLDLNEAMAAQKILGMEELLAQGILHEGDLPQRDQPEEKQEAIVEAEPQVQEPVLDEVIAEPAEQQKLPQEEPPVLSVKEDALREDLSEALQDPLAPVDTIDTVASQPEVSPIETPNPLSQQETPVHVEEQAVQTEPLQPDSVETPVKIRSPEQAASSGTDVPDILKYAAEQEELESSDDQGTNGEN